MPTRGTAHTESWERGSTPSERLLRDLLTSLLARTADGSVSWEVDDGHRDSYCLAGPDWLLATRSVDGDAMAPFALVVGTPDGEPALEARSNSPFGRPLSDLFAAVHSAAAASAAIAGAAPLLTRITATLSTPASGASSAPRRSARPGGGRRTGEVANDDAPTAAHTPTG